MQDVIDFRMNVIVYCCLQMIKKLHNHSERAQIKSASYADAQEDHLSEEVFFFLALDFFTLVTSSITMEFIMALGIVTMLPLSVSITV